MRRSILVGAAALALTAGGVALAQTTPAAGPSPGAPGIEAAPHEAWNQAGHEAWRPHPGMMRRARWQHPMFAPGTFALFHPPGDRHLTSADVQEIAQALLVWNGQHAWKVADVAPAGENRIGFAYAAPDGTVIARFAMNTATGHIFRLE